jgi:hypothetical protein
MDLNRRKALISNAALKVWAANGKNLSTQLYGFRLFRAHAAAGNLTAKDLDWAGKYLEPSEDHTIEAAWDGLRDAQQGQTSGKTPSFKIVLAKQVLADVILKEKRDLILPTLGFDNPTGRVELRESPHSVKAQAFLNRVLNKVAKSPTACRVLGEVVREYEAAGRKPVVYMGPDRQFEGTRVVLRHGFQGIQDGAIEAADVARGMAKVNPAFLDFSDQDLAADQAASSLAHEFEHLRLAAIVARTMPRYGQVLGRDFTGERSAHMVGWAAALELQAFRSQATMDTQELRDFMANPDWFWENRKLEAGYLIDLDLPELANPLRAYQERLARVNRILARGNLAQDTLKRYKNKQDALTKRISFLQTPKGQKLMEDCIDASQDPAYQSISKSVVDREQGLWRLIFRSPMPLSDSAQR